MTIPDLIIHILCNKDKKGIPGTFLEVQWLFSMLPLQGGSGSTPSLVGELKFHMLCSAANNKKKTKRKNNPMSW